MVTVEEGLPIPVDVSWERQEVIREWNRGYQAAVSYAKIYETTSISQGTTHEGVNLGYWIRNRRAEYQRGMLHQHVIQVVERIPYWDWEPSRTRWFKRYEELQKAFKRDEDRCLLVKAKFDGVPIGNWVRSQRVSYANGNLSKEYEKLLEMLPFWKWGNLKPYRRGKAKGMGPRRR